MDEMTLKQFIEEYSHGKFDFDRAGTTTCKGVVSTLSRDEWMAGQRFYESKFFRFAMHAMDELSMEEFLQDAMIEQDDRMDNLEDILKDDDELWSESSPDEGFAKFFEKIRHEVWKYETKLRAKPKKFVKLFRLVLGKALATRKAATSLAQGKIAEAEAFRAGVEKRDALISALFA